MGSKITYEFNKSQTQNPTQKKLNKTFECMKRFTYNKRIVYQNEFIDDIGWGCLLRAGQMLLFNMLFFKIITVKQCHSFVNRKNISETLLANFFSDKKEKIFSFPKILDIGVKKFNKNIEEFWNAKEFFVCVKESLQEENSQLNLCELIIDMDMFISDDGGFVLEDCLSSIEANKSVLLIFNLNIGNSKNRCRLCKDLISLLRLPFFAGGICGKNDEAYFLFGEQEESLLYLDPHKVQEGVYRKTFAVNYFHKISLKDINPSITLSFVANTIEDLTELKTQIEDICSELVFCKEKEQNDSFSSAEEFDSKFIESKNLINPISNKMYNEDFVDVDDTKNMFFVNGEFHKEEVKIEKEEGMRRMRKDSIKVLDPYVGVNSNDIFNDEVLYFTNKEEPEENTNDIDQNNFGKKGLKRNDSFLIVEENREEFLKYFSYPMVDDFKHI